VVLTHIENKTLLNPSDIRRVARDDTGSVNDLHRHAVETSRVEILFD
jgi:hypothetical protein